MLSGFALFFFARKTAAAQWFNLAANLVWAFLGYQLLISASMASHGQAFPVLFSFDWLPLLKSSFSLGIDGISIPLIVLNVFLSLVLAFYALGRSHLNASYLGLFSILNCASVGSLMATDLFLFYLFWEAMLIPMYFLIGKWGSENRIYATLKFFAFTMAGSLLLLLGIIFLSLQGNVTSLSWHQLQANDFAFEGWQSVQGLLFLAFAAAFVVKIPMWPFHTWLPDAHTEAPTGGSVILAGVLLKLGVYGLIRWCIPLFPDASLAASPIMMVCACAGIVLGSFAAWKQSDIKRMIAYSSVAHMGFMVLGLFSFQLEAMQGAMFQNIAHGLSTGALFLTFGMIYDRSHTRDIKKYGGLAAQNPVFAFVFIFASMASIGLPGLPGFVGEFLILAGTFRVAPAAALVGSLGILLGAVYMLSMVKGIFFGPSGHVSEEVAAKKITWNEYAALTPFILLMLWFGLQPQAILSISEQAIQLISTGVSK